MTIFFTVTWLAHYKPGKSTLQNELIGDFDSEFGSLPEGAEDLSLKALGGSLVTGRDFKLGKQSSKLVSRLIASKMPVRFNLNAARNYLAEKWGLGPSRQSLVLLFAIASEPQSRLPTVQAAEEYLDDLASRYAKSCGLVLQAQLPQDAALPTATQVVDPAFLDAFSKGQRKLATKQMKALAEYLQINLSHSSTSAESKSLENDLQEKLDLWHTEFSEEFGSGIKACFNTKKSRRYNAWWNVVRQDFISLYHQAEREPSVRVNGQVEKLEQHIANRSTESLLNLAKRLTALSSQRSGTENGFGPIGRRLAKTIAANTFEPPKFKTILPLTGPQTTVAIDGSITYNEVPRTGFRGQKSYVELLLNGTSRSPKLTLPFVNLKSLREGDWRPDLELTNSLLTSFSSALDTGVSFTGKDVLVTGAGPGSIGAEVVRALLMGGARVMITTSRAPAKTREFYAGIYEECGAQGSELIVFPFNQASVRDCRALIDHIYSKAGLNRDLDIIIPFAAMSEGGIEIDGLHDKSELAHRLMLVNLLRLLGHIITYKRERHINCRPTQVLLPLSPNHGIFGGDGLYSESKLGLESLLNRFQSESWFEELTICGVVIGWTRGTALMNGNDIVADAIESHNVLTFSQQEMAFNIVMLMTPTVATLCESEPIIADFGGGLSRLENCKSVLMKARSDIDSAVRIAKAVNDENKREDLILNKSLKAQMDSAKPYAIKRRSTLQLDFPWLPDFEKDLRQLEHLQGMVEPSSIVVVVGFSELGPWGSSRTRWEMESRGKLSQVGFIEMAWIMGLIKHSEGDSTTGQYVGWVDAKTGAQIHDSEIEEKYGQQILDHSGIRLVESEAFGGYDPRKKQYLQEIAIEEDLPEFDATPVAAEAFKSRHGENARIYQPDGSDDYRVQLKAGAQISVPKEHPFDWGLVGGQIPTGWNPMRYGIQEDLIHQVDPVTLYALCCVSEALYTAGITDSLEIFKHIHLSEMGNFIGSSMGGLSKTRAMYRDIYHDKDVQSDVIQETYLNTPAAWVNMLLLGSTGPIKTPVGACATGVESIDTGYDSLLSGKTKMCLVGGFDDFQEDESFGFSKMKATVNVAEEFAQGRLPSEMSRPTTETRAGFVESHGCGVQILCTAELALEMGLPIYGIIASSTMAADKVGRSVPAPGQGLLTFAREVPEARNSPLLDPEYRREQMQLYAHPSYNPDHQSVSCSSSSSWTRSTPDSESSGDFIMVKSSPARQANETKLARTKAIRKLWGNDLRLLDPNISPIRASLAVWGLGINDLEFASLHGTSTKANDKNESEMIDKQMTHLGREAGRPLLAICQKSITGHPKAPAAAWMLNGSLQAMNSRLVPGNRNADNVDVALRKYEHLVFPTRTIETTEIKAFLMTSFGFGQKGGQIVGVAPKYLFATLGKEGYEVYAAKVTRRKRLANRAYAKAMLCNKIVKTHDQPPYKDTEESKVFLNPLSRTSENGSKVNPGDATSAKAESDLALVAHVSRALEHQQNQNRGHDFSSVGVDVVDLKTFTSDENSVFIERNYTDAERRFAAQSLDPHATFASRWCAKEAVFKSLKVKSKGAGAAMKDIEIVSDEGVPSVKVSCASALRFPPY